MRSALRFFTGLLLVLACVGRMRGQRPPATCREEQIAAFNAGGDGGLGHGQQIVGLHNVSARACTLTGVPELIFLDAQGKRLAIPYGKNTGDYMFQPVPVRTVELVPGGFAYFSIGTTTGDQTLHFHRLEAMLPGDSTPFSVWAGPDGGMDGIDISAVTAGDGKDEGWVGPARNIPIVSGALRGLRLTLNVPLRPEQDFSALLTLHNEGVPVPLDWKECTLEETLTNSAGRSVYGTQTCETSRNWMGDMEDDALRPKGNATVNLEVGGDADLASGGMCREGRWTAELQLKTSVGTVRFAAFPFEAKSMMCSDSPPLRVENSAAIRWTTIPKHGVRLGVLLETAGGGTPAQAKFFTGATIPSYRQDQQVVAELFLDNLTDDPVKLRVGQGAFRTYVRTSGLNVPIKEIKASGKEDIPAGEVTVPPHTQARLEKLKLSEIYRLQPGDYDLLIGPRTLTGEADAANAPATGWPFTEDSATVSLLVHFAP